MLHSLVSRDIERLRNLHKQRDFLGLCQAFADFVKTPSLPMWRGWLDIFFIYDRHWFDAFFQYHQKSPSSASRAICLLLTYRKILHVRGDTSQRSCANQEQLIRDMVLATHGLVQPLLQDNRYKDVGFVIEALLHMVDAKSLDAQWRMHVVPNLGQDWRLIFFWGQVVVVMAHGEAREAIEEALSDCSEQERVVLEPLAFAYLSTDAQLAAGEDVVRFSVDPLCGDIFAIDMAEYCFEQGEHEGALSWISEKIPQLYDMPNTNEWLDGARVLIQEYAPQSSLFAQLVQHGVQHGLPGAIHARAMETLDEASLLANATAGHTESMVVLSEILRDSGREEEADKWLLRAASLFHSEALYMLGGPGSPIELDYLTQAVHRLHGPALFDVALGVLNNELEWKNHRVSLQKEGTDFDPPQAIDLLEKARDAGVAEAATLLFDVLANHVDETTFFALCYTAGEADSSYLRHGYEKALELANPERIFDWAQLMLEAHGSNQDVLFEFGAAAFRLGRTQIATKAWSDAANMGHTEAGLKMEAFRAGRLPMGIVPSQGGWQRTWRNLAEKFKRA